ncbi:glycosyltransferase family 2 protein [Clostridium perfringens]|uniref:glycosyltransferase n=1 Tax=Clostridium perfringens TaxID=1502 RepID=UPI00016BC6D8|nr:glycosyltransferase family 2 protein [Clostridium perfringens]EDT79011.1 putative glycosyl transferase [Clostridium perfringens NCTC 8239]ELC8383134.1 glycosyltransferase family 2 protein [Clostridium perfringens]MCX0358851.1 glycosyltransferase family 2 protein [Clostridium perfringens]MCX0419102.1 glycosyltransferase family 2 protein [Clostridium perfringens]MDK0588999.1 glycosyltransferase family 2 protein [Clostridium perfringens]
MKNVLVVLNYNDYITTEEFIDSIQNYNIINKIIVVDNNSTDNSHEILKKKINKKIDFLASDKNGGYAYGNNIGIKYAIERYNPKNIIISNPDVLIEEKCIINLINELNKNSTFGMITGTMLNSNKEISKGLAWKLPKYKDDIITSFIVLNKIFKPLEYNNKKLLNNTLNEVDVIPGSFFIAKAEALKKVRFFDEDTFLYCEERILSYKMKKMNYKIILKSDESYIHNHSITINKNISNYYRRYDILKNSKIIYMKKYLGVSKSKILFFNIIHNISKIEKFLLNLVFNKF